MNKLGFYTKNFGAPGVFDAFRDVKPPVLLTELDDKGMLRRIRNELSPDTFVIGRFHFTPGEQDAMLDDPNPVAVGIRLAEQALTHDFHFATQRGQDGRLFVDAWMTLNECIPGPNTDVFKSDPETMKRRAAAYDTMQVAFLNRMRQEIPDVEAVAFNFGAGNWAEGEHLIEFFPKTLEAYTYLGFHEYGWPHMDPDAPDASSGCGNYRKVMEVIRQELGDRHKVVITEAGLARMYKHPEGNDVGWLFPEDSVPEESYKESLRWYNQHLLEDDYALGACLFQVGPGGKWVTFRHTGLDNEGRPLTLMEELRALAAEPSILATPFDTPAATSLREGLYPPFVYGMHEEGGEHLMLEAGRRGWVLEIAEVGHEPQNTPSADYTHLSGDKGLGVIVRINHAFGSEGTIPKRDPELRLYHAFAESCAAFVSKTQGCRIWIIGNEPNHEVERPEGELILPEHYAEAYKLCRSAIKRVAGHQDDQVLVAGPALWNPTTTYSGNESGDWVKYFADTLSFLGPNECDGLAIHTYTHAHDPTKIRVDISHPSAGYEHLRDEFRTYIDFMEAIPIRFRRLPVYITETDPTERHIGWDDQNKGWVQAAYQEIAEWNSNAAHQPILSLVLYRWKEVDDQPEWSIVNRDGVQNDFRDSLRDEPAGKYRLRLPDEVPGPGAAGGPGEGGDMAPDMRLLINQMIITAFSRAGTKVNPDNQWVLLEKAGLSLGELAADRPGIYRGPTLDELPNLTEADRGLIRVELEKLVGPGGVEAAINFSVFSGEEAPTGFLRIRSELADVPLAPPREMMIDLATAKDSAEQGVVRTWNRYGWLLSTLADVLRIESGVAVAVLDTLGEGRGFSRDGRMRVRFENHIFHDTWGRDNPDKYEAHFQFDSRLPWRKHVWRPTSSGDWLNCHGKQGDEWWVFEFAQGLDDTAAKLSTAMGVAQILGLNYAAIGHKSVDQMYQEFAWSECYQIMGLFDLIAGPGSKSRQLSALQVADFENFAALHLGGRQAARYSSLLRRAYEAFQRLI
jgi:hypothetical protein